MSQQSPAVPESDAPPGQSPHGLTSGQGWAAFIVGCIVLAALFVAALRGALPPGLNEHAIRLSIAVAGAGFAVFLSGYFHWHMRNGVAAGGAFGIFVFLYWSTGDLAQSLAPDPSSLAQCERSLLNKQFFIAEELCTQAVADTGESNQALSLLASAQYHLKKVTTAVGTWERAISKGADAALTMYNIAFAYYTDGQYGKSSERARKAIEETATRPRLRSLLRFLLASAEFSLWNFVTDASASPHFSTAETNFKAFVENGEPKFRAHGYLACMYAVAGAAEVEQSRQERVLKQALVHFELAIDELRKFDGPTDKAAEVRAFVESFSSQFDQNCGVALASAWSRFRTNGTYEEQFARISE